MQEQIQSTNCRLIELEKDRELLIASSNQEKELRDTVSELENQLLEKNKVLS